MTSIVFSLALTVAMLVCCLGQAASPAEPVFRKISPSELPGLGVEGDLESLKTAITRQLERCATQDPSARFVLGKRTLTRRVWCTETNTEFLRMAESSTTFAELMDRAKTRFEWYQSTGRNGKGEVMFTGYHSPVLDAVLPKEATHSHPFDVPIYRKPDDLVQIVENGKRVWRRKVSDGSYTKYWDREAITQKGALKDKGFELSYTADGFDAYILQMEGAGVLRLHRPDGTVERRIVNYAAQNGQPFVSITQYLREQGLPTESLSVPGMRAYFRENPEKLLPTLSKDPSFVFFKVDDNGPYGVDSILLSPRHSIAVDLSVFPVGAVSLFQTERPEMNGDQVSGWRTFTTLALTQDTGGAIKGPGRVDVYWGEDAYAEQASGRMHHLGTLYLAVLP